MIITCPACETRYYAGETVLGSRARKVRCAKCAHEWLLEPEAPAEEAELEPADAPQFEDERAPSPAPEIGAERAPIVDRSAEPGYSADAADAYLTQRERRGGFSLDRIASGVLALMLLTLIGAASIQYRTQLVRLWPALGSLYAKVGMPVNARGLEIRKPEWRIESRNGRPVLIVKGVIANVADHPVAVPRLGLVLRDAKGHELYRWSAAVDDVTSVKPGASAPFTTTLESPPPEAHDIEIRFGS